MACIVIAACFLVGAVLISDTDSSLPRKILEEPIGATELGRVKLIGIDGLLRLQPFDEVVEVVWASSRSCDEMRNWYAHRFLTAYKLETEGPVTKVERTLVGRQPGEKDVVVGVTFNSESPYIRDVRPDLLQRAPSSSLCYITVRVVDLD